MSGAPLLPAMLGQAAESKGKTRPRAQVNTPARIFLVTTAFVYVGLIVILPFINIFIQVTKITGIELERTIISRLPLGLTPSWQAFRNGVGPFIENIMDEDFLHAVSPYPCTLDPDEVSNPKIPLTGSERIQQHAWQHDHGPSCVEVAPCCRSSSRCCWPA